MPTLKYWDIATSSWVALVGGPTAGAVSNEVAIGPTSPGSPGGFDLWVDTSVTPVVERFWNGAAWVALGPSGAAGGELSGTYPNPSLLGSPWAFYTPVVSGMTGFVQGNGVLTGRWEQVRHTVRGEVYFTFGSSTTLGTGTMSISLPVPVTGNKLGGGAGVGFIGTSSYRTNAGAYFIGLTSAPASATSFTALIPTSTTVTNLGRWSNTQPSGQVAGDSWYFGFGYEVDT